MPASPPANSAIITPWRHNRRPGRARRHTPAAAAASPGHYSHGVSEPACTLRTTSPETQGSYPGPARGPSPARLNAVGTPSPLELRRAQEPRAAYPPTPCRTPAPGPGQDARQHARSTGRIPDKPRHLREHPRHPAATRPNHVPEPVDECPLTLVSAEALCAEFHMPFPRKRSLMPQRAQISFITHP